jgi:hypothetical protein
VAGLLPGVASRRPQVRVDADGLTAWWDGRWSQVLERRHLSVTVCSTTRRFTLLAVAACFLDEREFRPDVSPSPLPQSLSRSVADRTTQQLRRSSVFKFQWKLRQSRELFDHCVVCHLYKTNVKVSPCINMHVTYYGHVVYL